MNSDTKPVDFHCSGCGNNLWAKVQTEDGEWAACILCGERMTEAQWAASNRPRPDTPEEA